MTVRFATKRDLGAIIETHLDAFPDFFLSRLGPAFLRQYYATLLEHDSGILLVAGAAPACEGFAAGSSDPGAFYAALRRRRIRLALAALPTLVRCPGLLRRLTIDARRVGAQSRDRTGTRCELASLAVRGVTRGQGTGALLVRAFTAEAAARRSTAVYVKTDVMGNDSVLRFYRRLGFEQTALDSSDRRRPMAELTLSLVQ